MLGMNKKRFLNLIMCMYIGERVVSTNEIVGKLDCTASTVFQTAITIFILD